MAIDFLRRIEESADRVDRTLDLDRYATLVELLMLCDLVREHLPDLYFAIEEQRTVYEERFVTLRQELELAEQRRPYESRVAKGESLGADLENSLDEKIRWAVDASGFACSMLDGQSFKEQSLHILRETLGTSLSMIRDSEEMSLLIELYIENGQGKLLPVVRQLKPYVHEASLRTMRFYEAAKLAYECELGKEENK
ncbi:hypothetical protein GF342_00635 [Candidatus Woesearchaeota archaeon]|nr:hypothetical protein [Candidatus Woesearchaeota archaeon]